MIANGGFYRFNPATTTTVDGSTIVAAQTAGRFTRTPTEVRGADLADGAATLRCDGHRLFVLPAGTLTGNSVLTLGTPGAVANDWLRIVRQDAEAYTYTIQSAAAVTLVTFASATASWADFSHDGSAWFLTAKGTL